MGMNSEEKQNYIRSLAKNLGFETSFRLQALLDQLMSEEEAKFLSLLPGTVDDLVIRTGIEKKVLLKEIDSLFIRGLLLISENEDGLPVYVFDSKPGRFMDSIMFDPRYREEKSQEFFDEWKAFYNEEMIPTHVERPESELPFRVISVSREIEGQQKILPYEHVEKIIDNAEKIAVQDCPCRVRERNCDNPLQTCISLNNLADYVISRGIGRALNKDEAKQILRNAEELGLIHEVDNNVNATVVCNCCTCCCTFLRAVTKYHQDSVVAKSRFRAFIAPEVCINCGVCRERCQFEAILENEDAHSVHTAKCIGCGLCVSSCPVNAIRMELVEGRDHIPTTRATFFEGVDKTPWNLLSDTNQE